MSELSTYSLGQRSIVRTVRTLDSGDGRTLDTGPAIDPASLRLTRSTLSWTNNGQLRTVPLA